MSDVVGIVSSIDTVVTNLNRDPLGAFLAAREIGMFPLRDIALANQLSRPQVDGPNNKIIWTEGSTGMTSVSLATAISANDTTTFDFGTTNINGIVPNMILSFNTEIVRVTAVDYAAGTCTVSRGYAGTTALAAIATTVVGTVLSVTPADDEDAGSATAAFGSVKTNYLHYFEEVVKIADKAVGQSSQMRSPEADVAYQVADKIKKISRELAYALWNSKALSTGAYRLMDGFRAQATTNATAVDGALLFSTLDDAVQKAMDAGVVPDTLAVPGLIKKGMAPWASSRLKTVVNGDPSTAGGTLNTYESAHGPVLNIVVDTSLLPTDAFVCRASDLHCGPVPVLPQVAPAPDLPQATGIRAERLGRKGAYQEVQCLAYFTSQLTNEAGQVLLTGISSVDADGKS